MKQTLKGKMTLNKKRRKYCLSKHIYNKHIFNLIVYDKLYDASK